MNSSVWVEKYRPKEVDDFCLSDKMIKILKYILEKKKIPNMTLFSKSPGTGKTSIAKFLAYKLCDDDEVLFINGSLNRNIDMIRNEMTEFVYAASFSGNKKVIIIDEYDGINTLAQTALRSFIEEHSDHCSFLLTCNDASKIIQPIASRCPIIDITPKGENRPEIAQKMLDRLEYILRDNLIEYDEEAVKTILKTYFPDMRLMINELQRTAINGKFTADNIIVNDYIKTSPEIDQLFTFINTNDWNNLRIWVHKNFNSYNVIELVYNKYIDLIDAERASKLILICGDYCTKLTMTQSKEITTIAFITEVLKLLQDD